MANGKSNHPEPLEQHEVDDNGEDSAENDTLLTSDVDQNQQSDFANEPELFEVDQAPEPDTEDVEEEYAALEQTIDQLDSCLNSLEQKNDDLNAKLRALLEASRLDYAEISASSTGGEAGDHKS